MFEFQHSCCYMLHALPPPQTFSELICSTSSQTCLRTRLVLHASVSTVSTFSKLSNQLLTAYRLLSRTMESTENFLYAFHVIFYTVCTCVYTVWHSPSYSCLYREYPGIVVLDPILSSGIWIEWCSRPRAVYTMPAKFWTYYVDLSIENDTSINDKV